MPKFNVHTNWDLLVNRKHVENTIVINYGPNHKDLTKRVYMSQVFNHVIVGEDRNIDCDMKLKSKSLVSVLGNLVCFRVNLKVNHLSAFCNIKENQHY